MRIIKHNTMAINVTLGEAGTVPVKEFPKLMKAKNTSLVVFFGSYKCGQVIIDDVFYRKGFFSNEWIMESFTDYNEPITIQNA